MTLFAVEVAVAVVVVGLLGRLRFVVAFSQHLGHIFGDVGLCCCCRCLFKYSMEKFCGYVGARCQHVCSRVRTCVCVYGNSAVVACDRNNVTARLIKSNDSEQLVKYLKCPFW